MTLPSLDHLYLALQNNLIYFLLEVEGNWGLTYPFLFTNKKTTTRLRNLPSISQLLNGRPGLEFHSDLVHPHQGHASLPEMPIQLVLHIILRSCQEIWDSVSQSLSQGLFLLLYPYLSKSIWLRWIKISQHSWKITYQII